MVAVVSDRSEGIIRIDDPHDPRVADFASLTDMDFRRRMEQPAGLFIAEGYLVLERVVATGMKIRTILTIERRIPRVLDTIAPLAGDERPEIMVADESVLRSITGFDVHRGVLASVHRPTERDVADVASIDGHLAVLEGLVDPTNVGLAFRSATAMGFAACILSADCADPLYRRAVRTSMGTVLAMPWARGTSWMTDSEQLRASGRVLIALSPDPENPSLDEVLTGLGTAPVAAIFGSEGPGLAASTLRRVDVTARIPMSAGVDSLNVAATVAVVGYALRWAHGSHVDTSTAGEPRT